MKKLLLITLLVFATGALFAQTDGMSYQAVIINPNIQEIPGVDVSGNILPNTTVSIRFTIIDSNNLVEYQEVQTTTTDAYGMINLLIGTVDYDAFTLISWDGTNKDLKVEIDFEGGIRFVDMSRQQLTFLPYASHRNITASGTLDVDGNTVLNGELTVEQPTHLNSTLDVNNNSASNLTGDLTVGGATIIEGTTNLNSSLDVNNKSITNLSGELNVGEDIEAATGGPFDELAPTKLNGKLNVVGLTTMNGLVNKGLAEFDDLKAINLEITEVSHLKGDATIDGTTAINGITTINNNATITGITSLTGLSTTISGVTTIDNNTTVNGETTLNGPTIFNADQQQVIIRSNNTGGLDSNINSYPLLVEGGKQGIAIKVTGNNRNNNFVSFFNGTKVLGRIEGQTDADLGYDYNHAFETAQNVLKGTKAGVTALVTVIEATYSTAEVAMALSSTTPCVGFGACVTLPIPSMIVGKAAKTILKIAKSVKIGLNVGVVAASIGAYVTKTTTNLGVTFLSGGADYAEFLPKENNFDEFVAGELVGVKNGLVSKDIWGAEKIMIVSTKPIVLGNMPQPENEMNSVKIAFMGQVPTKVFGTVAPGDYIMPNLLVSGFARAVNPNDMKTRDFKKVAGVAWNIISENSGISIVNVAVGINTNDLSDVVYQQEEELTALRAIAEQLQIQMEQSSSVLAKLVPGYAEATGTSPTLKSNQHQENTIAHKEDANNGNIINDTAYQDDIIYFELSREQLEAGIAIAREVYIEALDDQSSINKLIAKTNGKSTIHSKEGSIEGIAEADLMSIKNHPFWKKMDHDPAYKEEVVQTIQYNLSKSFHTHKKYEHNFKTLKVRRN
jgi:hypothetical protein